MTVLLVVRVLLLILVLSYYLSYTYNYAVIAQDNTSISNNFANSNNSSSNIDSNSNRSYSIINTSSSFYPSIFSKSGIDVNTFPVGIAVNPNTNKVYVANEYSNTVSIIGTETDKVQATINVGNFPYGIDIDPVTNRVYVANRGSNTVSVIDGSIDTKLRDIHVGKSPVGIAVNPSANWIYVTNLDDDTLSVIDGITNEVIDTISVGNIPYGIAVNPLSNKIYVSNIASNTVSVIDGDTKNITAKILVGKRPTGLAIDISKGNNRLYVANHDSNSVSVIDTLTNKLIDNIASVGDSPVGIAINSINSKLYVSNIASNTVSVIDTKAINIDDTNNETNSDTTLLPTTAIKKNNNVILKEIGVNPTLKESYSSEDSLVNLPINVGFPFLASQITINPVTNMVYVTNTGSNTVSIIDGNTNSLVVGLTFSITPSNSGELECVDTQNNNKIIISTNQYVRIDYGKKLECNAHPYPSNTFGFWSDTLTSSSLINSTERSPTPSNYLFDLRSDSKNKIQLDIGEYGNITANFKEIPPPIPPEYWITLYGVIVSSIIGWSIPSIVGWIKVRSHQKRLRYYHSRIQYLYDDGKLDQNDIESLDALQIEIVDAYAKGKLTELHYTNLKNETSLLYEEIYRKKIDSLNSSISDKNYSKFLDEIKSDITDAYAKGKLNEVHYNLLNEKISKRVTDNNLKGKVYIESIKRSPV